MTGLSGSSSRTDPVSAAEDRILLESIGNQTFRVLPAVGRQSAEKPFVTSRTGLLTVSPIRPIQWQNPPVVADSVPESIAKMDVGETSPVTSRPNGGIHEEKAVDSLRPDANRNPIGSGTGDRTTHRTEVVGKEDLRPLLHRRIGWSVRSMQLDMAPFRRQSQNRDRLGNPPPATREENRHQSDGNQNGSHFTASRCWRLGHNPRPKTLNGPVDRRRKGSMRRSFPFSMRWSAPLFHGTKRFPYPKATFPTALRCSTCRQHNHRAARIEPGRSNTGRPEMASPCSWKPNRSADPDGTRIGSEFPNRTHLHSERLDLRCRPWRRPRIRPSLPARKSSAPNAESTRKNPACLRQPRSQRSQASGASSLPDPGWDLNPET